MLRKNLKKYIFDAEKAVSCCLFLKRFNFRDFDLEGKRNNLLFEFFWERERVPYFVRERIWERERERAYKPTVPTCGRFLEEIIISKMKE